MVIIKSYNSTIQMGKKIDLHLNCLQESTPSWKVALAVRPSVLSVWNGSIRQLNILPRSILPDGIKRRCGIISQSRKGFSFISHTPYSCGPRKQTMAVKPCMEFRGDTQTGQGHLTKAQTGFLSQGELISSAYLHPPKDTLQIFLLSQYKIDLGRRFSLFFSSSLRTAFSIHRLISFHTKVINRDRIVKDLDGLLYLTIYLLLDSLRLTLSEVEEKITGLNGEGARYYPLLSGRLGVCRG